MNQEFPDVRVGFRKGRETRDQIANIRWIIGKARELQKNIYCCCIDYVKAFDCVNHNKLWKILKEMGIPDHHNCLLRNLYAGQEATVRTGHGTMDWFQIGKGARQVCILSPCFSSVISVAQSCPTLCDPMDCSMPGFPICHQLQELAQTHVHRVSNAIQQSHPLSSPFPPAFNHPTYLTYMQSTSCKMLGWMKHKLESRYLGDKSITLYMQMTPAWQKVKTNQRAS